MINKLAEDNYHLIDEFLGSVGSYHDDEAQMVVTDAFLRALDTYDSSKSSFKTYFYVCARNARRSLGRTRQARPTEIAVEDIDLHASVGIYDSVGDDVIKEYLVEKLSGEERELMLLEDAGYTHREIARKKGISRQGISSRIKRIKARLRKDMEVDRDGFIK